MAIEPFIEFLTENTNPEAGDYVVSFDNDAPEGDKDRKLDLARLALLAQANIFTANQRFNALVGVNVAPDSSSQVNILSGAANRNTLRLDTAASPTAGPLIIAHNGTNHLFFMFDGVQSHNLISANFDNGAGVGNRITLGRNSNASTPAAAHIALRDLGNTIRRIWPDASGNLRIHNADPTNANDTAGTVVGTQTSAAAAKDIDETLPDWRESINHIIEAVQGGALRSWKYKSGAYNNEHYPIGIVTDYAGRYGMDRGEDAPHGRSLNIAVAIGDLMGAVVTLAERVAELEAKLNG